MTITRTNPFAIKEYSKWSARRIAFTAKARLIEQESKWNFEKYALPEKILANLPDAPNANYKDTDVTPRQMQYLLEAVNITEQLQDTVIVEVGCYRGITTKILAQATSRQVIAVDPYIGYGGSQLDLNYFQNNIADLPNVIHKRTTSGEAFSNWKYGSASLVFIDAVHDYVNTAFDIEIWSSLIVRNGILAMHDTDLHRFAGTRKAAFEAQRNKKLFAHPLV